MARDRPWYSEKDIEDWLCEHIQLFLPGGRVRNRQEKLINPKYSYLRYPLHQVIDICAIDNNGRDVLIEVKRDYISAKAVRDQALIYLHDWPISPVRIVVAAPRISDKALSMVSENNIEYWQVGVGGKC